MLHAAGALSKSPSWPPSSTHRPPSDPPTQETRAGEHRVCSAACVAACPPSRANGLILVTRRNGRDPRLTTTLALPPLNATTGCMGGLLPGRLSTQKCAVREYQQWSIGGYLIPLQSPMWPRLTYQEVPRQHSPTNSPFFTTYPKPLKSPQPTTSPCRAKVGEMCSAMVSSRMGGSPFVLIHVQNPTDTLLQLG